MIIVGITGGIASGKTTVVNFLKKKRIAIHDSDLIIKKTYINPSSGFINYLKKISPMLYNKIIDLLDKEEENEI